MDEYLGEVMTVLRAKGKWPLKPKGSGGGGGRRALVEELQRPGGAGGGTAGPDPVLNT
jgi:hypothetical protein